MTLARLRPRLVLAVVALVATGLLVAKLVSSGSTGPARASTADPHAIPHYQAGQLRHLLADEQVDAGSGRSFIRYEPIGPVLAPVQIRLSATTRLSTLVP